MGAGKGKCGWRCERVYGVGVEKCAGRCGKVCCCPRGDVGKCGDRCGKVSYGKMWRSGWGDVGCEQVW